MGHHPEGAETEERCTRLPGVSVILECHLFELDEGIDSALVELITSSGLPRIVVNCFLTRVELRLTTISRDAK